jgi:SAM-dependent methyltransferase
VRAPDETDRVSQRWGDAALVHQLTQIDWMASPAVLLHLNERATGHPARDWLSGWARRYFIGADLKVLVIGCGEGWLERAVAGWPEVAHVEAVDVAESAVARAREESEKLALTNISYRVADLNGEELPPSAYDVVVAHSILHHVSALEHLLAQIERSLTGEGILIVNEYVGPARFQFSDEILDAINELFVCLPPRLRRSQLEGRMYERRERPDRDTVVAADPSEAVRSDELPEQIRSRFTVFDDRNIGGTLLQQLLYDVVQNFRFEDSRERSMIEICCQIEALLVDAGAIPAHFVVLAAKRRNAGPVKPRRIPALVLKGDLFDDDPLGWGRSSKGLGQPIAGRRDPRLTHRMLEILRVALLSVRPQRRMLIRKRRSLEIMEQIRYASSREASPFDWIRARHAAVMGEANEDDAAIARLLDACERLAQRLG